MICDSVAGVKACDLGCMRFFLLTKIGTSWFMLAKQESMDLCSMEGRRSLINGPQASLHF